MHAQKRLLDLTYARSLVTAGRGDDARAAFKQLVETYPRDGRIHEEYAMLLGQSAKPDERQQALAQWRKLERGSKAGSPRWFKAKYHLAELLLATGDKEAAAKLIDVTAVLYPELGGAEWKSQFQQLRERCH